MICDLMKKTTLIVPPSGNCGSCYAFASMALLEARIRLLTNNTERPILSTQDIVECSAYSQVCLKDLVFVTLISN